MRKTKCQVFSLKRKNNKETTSKQQIPHQQSENSILKLGNQINKKPQIQDPTNKHVTKLIHKMDHKHK